MKVNQYINNIRNSEASCKKSLTIVNLNTKKSQTKSEIKETTT